MAKVSSNEHVKVAWILDADLTNPDSPSPTELNGDGIDISQAIALDGYELGATDSDDNEDRALTDVGSAVTRGFANYAASLPFFYDADFSDTTSVYNDAFDAFRTELTTGYLVSRVGPFWNTPFAAGDVVSVFKFTAGAVSTDISGDSYKFVVDYLPQGELYVNTLVETAAPVVALPATVSSTVGDVDVITASVAGKNVTHSAVYSSSDSAVVSVSQLGVTTSNGTGTATITVTHPSSTAPDTVSFTVA